MLTSIKIYFLYSIAGFENSPRHGTHSTQWNSFISSQIAAGKEWAVCSVAQFQHVINSMAPVDANNKIEQNDEGNEQGGEKDYNKPNDVHRLDVLHANPAH